MTGWEIYSRALVPTVAPHVDPDASAIESGAVWHGLSPLFARWTSAFDCGCETNWWYVIKDTLYQPEQLKAKRRYEITKGRRNFNVRRIDPREHAEALYAVQIDAFSVYPAKYRPTVNHDAFLRELECWEGIVYGAFHAETGELSGYSRLIPQGKCLHFTVQKVRPSQEKNAVNAALVDGLLCDNRDALASGCYICDGARPILHETHFQDYLEKYFGFRKAYCRLHIAYAPLFRHIVRLLYLFRNLLRRLDGIGAIHKINAILMMESIVRSTHETDNHI